jgi:CheY-like chemotaxis protein
MVVGNKHFKSVLIIDDDDINNHISERLLNKLNVADKISIARNGEEGIKCLQEYCTKTSICPDLILLDINMPVMDGFEFLKKFQLINFENKHKVIVAVLTTSSDPRDKIKMEAYGVEHYLNKPLTERAILKFIESIH